MGAHSNISIDKFPKQGSYLHREVKVCFNYQFEKTIDGKIIRDDDEKPFVRIIELANGRVVLASECMYKLK